MDIRPQTPLAEGRAPTRCLMAPALTACTSRGMASAALRPKDGLDGAPVVYWRSSSTETPVSTDAVCTRPQQHCHHHTC